MKTVVASVVLLVLILIAALLLGLAGTLGIAGVGWIVSRLFSDLSLFEASLLALLATAALLLVAFRILGATASPLVQGEEEEEEEEEEEFEPPIVPWRRSKLTDPARSADRDRKQRDYPKRR